MGFTFETKAILAELLAAIGESEWIVSSQGLTECRLKLRDLNLQTIQISNRSKHLKDSIGKFKLKLRLTTQFYRYGNGELNESDIITFWAENGIHCSHRDASLIIAQYDENSNGRLWFTEFNQLSLPATNETMRILATSRDYTTFKLSSTVFSPSLESALARLISAEIEFQRRTDSIRLDLNSRFDFTVRGAFDLIDTMSSPNRIDRYEIRKYVDLYLRWLSEAELDAIIRRCDTDGDESLSYLEFSEAIRGIAKAEPLYSPRRIEEISPMRASSPLRVTTTF